MPTPAEILLEASSLDSGTPWELLNSISCSGGVVLSDGLEIEMDCVNFDVEIDLFSFDAEIEYELEVELEEIEFEAEVCI